MKAKLHKMMSGYILSLNGDIDDPYAIVNKELAEDYEWYRLSFKNCQAIELGYDLDELSSYWRWYYSDIVPEYLRDHLKNSYEAGFYKALKILGDKKFSEEDVIDCWETAHQAGRFEGKGIAEKDWQTSKEYIQSLQQTEWDVEIEMTKEEYIWTPPGEGFEDQTYRDWREVPKLDADGCLILKRI